MVEVDRPLEKVKAPHVLDNVTTENVSDVITKKEIDKALKVQEHFMKLRELQMKTTFEIAETLKAVRDNRWYKIYGYDDFNSWLESPEVDFDRAVAYRHIRILEVFILTGAFTKDELYNKAISKLEILIPYVTPREKGWAKMKKEIFGMLDLTRVDLTTYLNEQKEDNRYTPERETSVTKNKVTDAEFEEVSEAKAHSKEATGRSLHREMLEEADAKFEVAEKVEKVVSTNDVKKQLGLGGWYKLVAVEMEEDAGKVFKGLTLHVATAKKRGSDIFIDIE